MSAEHGPGEGGGTVITIGSGGTPVERDSLAVEAAREIAEDTGTTVIVTRVETPEEEGDGHPIEFNPLPPPSPN